MSARLKLSWLLAICTICCVACKKSKTNNNPTVTVTTIAGDGNGVQFNFPAGVTADAKGNLYVADQDNNRIRKIVVATGVVTTLAGSTTGTAGTTDGIGSAAQFTTPTGITIDATGDSLYVTDQGSNRIRKIVVATGLVTTLAGSTAGPTDGVGSAAQFNTPLGIAIDATGDSLYVADYGNDHIRKIVIATRVVSTLGGAFVAPTGVAVDAANNLYVSETDQNRIWKVALNTSTKTVLAGNPTPGATDGIGIAALFNSPSGLALDNKGNLYVADKDNNSIRKIVISTGEVTTLAGDGTANFADGIGKAALFNKPYGLTVDAVGNIYVADLANNRIRKITIK